MTAQISIVLPTLNAAEHLPATADALLPGLSAGLVRELIVCDGGSTDATPRVADALGAEWHDCAPHLPQQFAAGAAAAKAEWILLLRSDARPDPRWPDAVGAHMATHPDRAARFRLAGGALAAALNLRAALGRPDPRHGLLVRRNQLDDAGGAQQAWAALRRQLRHRMEVLPVPLRLDAQPSSN
ncbi:Glycosyl transferase family 2 [Tranquillimonas rosea]|uniref:Glycosyl transferase family 2 n=1 Tax=Tranquillimonas rosea TaxID=641238 RepID=A0A1H9WXU9_9RHOB|nr:glycosyltransferase [Tranquillimonas rosea]SES38674.1 Glycosyl transferase family 2 [Tranquillimonas rosea]